MTKKNLTNLFKRYVFVLMVATLFMTVLLMRFGIGSVVDRLSSDLAQLYTSDLVNEIERHVIPELSTTQAIVESRATQAFLKEATQENKTAFLEVLSTAYSVSEADTLFVASAYDNSMYFYKDGELQRVGELAPTIEDDTWFYESLALPEPFNLNIDVDRFLKQTNVWINYKVVDASTDLVLGIVGVGLPLKRYVEQIDAIQSKHNAKMIIVNGNGAIQLDSDFDRIVQNIFAFEVADDKSFRHYINDSDDAATVLEAFQKNQNEVFVELRSGAYDYVSAERIYTTDWYVMTFYHQEGLVSTVQFVPLLLIAVLFIIWLAVIINRLFNRMLGRPFDDLSKSLKAQKGRDVISISGANRNDEFGEVSRAIEHLSNRLVQSVPVGIFEMEPNLKLRYANTYFLSLFAVSDIAVLNEALDTQPHTVFAAKETRDWLIESVATGENAYRFEVEFVNKRRETFWGEMRLTKKGDVYEGLLINIQEQKRYVNRLMDLAETDALTGLKNRRALDATIKSEIERAKRYRLELAIVMFDLDKFKDINDTFGHDVGDKVIVETIELFKTQLRATDFFARWGGEEFMILLPETALSSASEVAEKLRQRLEQHVFGAVGTVTASFGVAPWLIGDTPELLFSRVDKCMLSAKKAGRNRCDIFEVSRLPSVHMPWHSSYESGDNQIDFEHKQLFEFANAFLSDQNAQKSEAYHLNQMKQLIDLIAQHFENEVLILENCKYPDPMLDAHKRLHESLLRCIREHYEAVQRGEMSVGDFYLHLVEEVVYKHMIDEDTKFFAFLKGEH